jgi:Holliday junction resolvase
MATTPEGKVKKKVADWLKKVFPDYFRYMPIPSGYGVKGIPDMLCCINGKFVAIEVKSKPGMQPTKLQQKRLEEITKAGGFAICMDGFNEVKLQQIVEWVEAA